MKFTVLSHAGLLIESDSGKKVLCDPWLLSSCYWRSWWNYPPVSKELISDLQPDVIYMTHIHWDHFHGPSLKKFSKDVKILVPKGNFDRCKRDLRGLGFHNVHEMKHAESYKIDDSFQITSYQFGIFLDSAPVIECDGQTLLNLNDCKHMGGTLKQIVKNHPSIDFVFRSHSSANSRLSYEVVDDPAEEVDDIETYIQNFAHTVRATGAKYAVPFASNHCHLHKDSWKYNHLVQTPDKVEQYFIKNGIEDIALKVMVSGDSWHSEQGFDIAEHDWFSNRSQRLEEYRDSKQKSLDKFYSQEDNTKVRLGRVARFYATLAAKLPFILKKKLAGVKYTYVLYTQDSATFIFNIEIATGAVEEVDAATELDFDRYPIQIHTSAFIFLRCISFRIFSHLSISKRVVFKMKKAELSKMKLLNLIYNMDDYDMLPLSKNFSQRSFETWRLRYREIFLYCLLLKDKILTKKLDVSKYLIPLSK